MALKYICAYKMLQLAGKAAPSDKEVKALLDAAGIEVDAKELKLVLTKLGDVDTDEAITAGLKNLEAMGGGGGGGAAAAAAAGGAAAGGAPAEEKKKEEPEEEEEDMDFDLFG